MDAGGARDYDPPMPTLELTDDELRDAAQPARLAARRAFRDSEIQPCKAIRDRLASEAERCWRLAQRFEDARPRPNLT